MRPLGAGAACPFGQWALPPGRHSRTLWAGGLRPSVEFVSSWVTLEPPSVTVEAGGEAETSVRIRNTSDIVEEYHLDVVGAPGAWCTAEPATLRLYPGTTGTVRLTFAPPRGPDPVAGPHPYGVRVKPVEAPDAVTVPEGSVSVGPFTDVRAELVPVIVRGWRRVRPRLAVDNYGNTTVTAAVRAATQDNSVGFDAQTPSFQVPPGRAHFNVLTGRPYRLLWMGQKIRHPFTAMVTPSGSAPVSVSGTYVQTGLLPSWISRLLAALLALLIAFLALWFLAKPSVATKAVAQTAGAPSVAPHASSAPTSAAPSAAAGGQTTQAQASPSVVAAGGAPAAGSGQPRPIGYWKLIEGASNTPATTAVDSSSGQHPLSGQAEWCNGGGCAWFNGQNAQLATSAPIVDTTKSFTVAAYVNLYSIPANGASATAVGQDGTRQSAFFLQYSGQDNSWAFAGANGRAETTATPVTANTWVYLTGVYDAPSDTMTLYVNGQPGEILEDAQLAPGSGPVSVGRGQYNGSSTDWWNGGIKNVEIFGQALNQQQIQTLDQRNSH